MVKTANNYNLKIGGIGTILIDARVNNQWESRRLENVLYVRDIKQNLFSTAVLTDKSVKVLVDNIGCQIIDKSNNVVAVAERYELNQLKMNVRLRINKRANVAAVSIQHWHRRLGHINSIKKMCKDS